MPKLTSDEVDIVRASRCGGVYRIRKVPADDVGTPRRPTPTSASPSGTRTTRPSRLRERDEQGRRPGGHLEDDHRPGVPEPVRRPTGQTRTEQAAEAPEGEHGPDAARVQPEVADDEEHEEGAVAREREVGHAALHGEEPEEPVVGHDADAGRHLPPERLARSGAAASAPGCVGSIRCRQSAETRNESASATTAYAAETTATSAPPSPGPATCIADSVPARRALAAARSSGRDDAGDEREVRGAEEHRRGADAERGGDEVGEGEHAEGPGERHRADGGRGGQVGGDHDPARVAPVDPGARRAGR